MRPPRRLWLRAAPSSGAESLVATDEVREIVGVLAADSLEGRRTGTPGSARASRFLAERMRRYGLEPAGDSGYFQRVTYRPAQGPEGETLRLASPDSADTADAVVDYNLVGLIRGSDRSLRNEAVVLGAHFDHIGIGKPVEGDSINNGADDDASGVATVLAAARALAKDPPKRTVVVLLTSGEEYGVLGTQWYLERPRFPLDSTVADLQVEMVGRPDTLVGAGQALAHRLRALHHGGGAERGRAPRGGGPASGVPVLRAERQHRVRDARHSGAHAFRPTDCTTTTTSRRTRWSGSTSTTLCGSPTW